jgi:hypothetical protein
MLKLTHYSQDCSSTGWIEPRPDTQSADFLHLSRRPAAPHSSLRFRLREKSTVVWPAQSMAPYRYTRIYRWSGRCVSDCRTPEGSAGSTAVRGPNLWELVLVRKTHVLIVRRNAEREAKVGALDDAVPDNELHRPPSNVFSENTVGGCAKSVWVAGDDLAQGKGIRLFHRVAESNCVQYNKRKMELFRHWHWSISFPLGWNRSPDFSCGELKSERFVL